jgi:hypothetical protein
MPNSGLRGRNWSFSWLTARKWIALAPSKQRTVWNFRTFFSVSCHFYCSRCGISARLPIIQIQSIHSYEHALIHTPLPSPPLWHPRTQWLRLPMHGKHVHLILIVVCFCCCRRHFGLSASVKVAYKNSRFYVLVWDCELERRGSVTGRTRNFSFLYTVDVARRLDSLICSKQKIFRNLPQYEGSP